jgi:hypothetical protein
MVTQIRRVPSIDDEVEHDAVGIDLVEVGRNGRVWQSG